MDIYSVIADGIRQYLPANNTIEKHLEGLQVKVKGLRRAYFNVPVNVEYADIDIQAAYLLTYFPHYYQLIYSILVEKCPSIFSGKDRVNLIFVGGGPGSEVYGVLKFIANNCPAVKFVDVEIMDINGSTWIYSHKILEDNVLRKISDSFELSLISNNYDITSTNDTELFKQSFEKCDLIVVQNCLNEIASSSHLRLEQNFELIFDLLPTSSHLLLCDLTSGARTILKKIEHFLSNKFSLKLLTTTLANASPTSIVSVHHKPSVLVGKYLLNGEDGLIPRKYIKYDYSLLVKADSKASHEDEALGVEAIYNPLNFSSLDPNGFLGKKVFIGLDFGTSCSVASMAYLKDGEVILGSIPIPQSDHLGGKSTSPLVPSNIVLYENRLLVGRHAAEMRAMSEDGKNCWHSFKQSMHQIEDISFPLSELAGNATLRIANGSDALVIFFRYLKREIDAYLTKEGLLVDAEYGISIPAGYSSKEKLVLKSHLELAGISCIDVPFIEEPTAALVNYLFENPRPITAGLDEIYLVLDIGAGTVDVSIVELSSDSSGQKSKLLSVMRVGNIGSNQIDLLLSHKVLEKKINRSPTEAIAKALQGEGEKLKVKLCKSIHVDGSVAYMLPDTAFSDTSVSVPVDKVVSGGKLTSFSITYGEFDSVMDKYWEGSDGSSGLLGTLNAAMAQSKMRPETIDRVIVSGGGARNPYIKAKVADLFGPDKMFIPDDIQEQVSRGTALHSMVVNCFGKSIINSLTNQPVFIEGAEDRIKIFDIGESIPSDDHIIELKIAKTSNAQHLMGYFGEEMENLKYFEIPSGFAVDKLVFYIDTDQELRCDIVTSSSVNRAKEHHELTNPTYINVNS